MILILFVTFGTLLASSSANKDESTESNVSAAFKNLPPVFSGHKYKVDPYIRAAMALQAIGKEQACKQLASFAEKTDNNDKVIVLCRMLFKEKKDGKFRRPSIGAPFFVGKTSMADWPREPIEIVDGVPLLITWGYLVYGLPESAESYLNYCQESCDWNDYKFKKKTYDEQTKALTKLFDSKKWGEKLRDVHKEFIEAQINNK
jgi:hypothetical protein